jgi:hypothetical protein
LARASFISERLFWFDAIFIGKLVYANELGEPKNNGKLGIDKAARISTMRQPLGELYVNLNFGKPWGALSCTILSRTVAEHLFRRLPPEEAQLLCLLAS